jgi:hypothetical protein
MRTMTLLRPRKTIRPDGSLDPIADFEDDGASFRVRREAYLKREFGPRSMWSKPRNKREAVSDGLKIGLLIGVSAAMIPAGIFVLMIVLWATGH